jgi:SAM-dependent methyltransferase
MNNPARAWLQRRCVARWLERLGGPVPGGRALEVGCGRGAAVRLVMERFGARRVVGLDLDVRMIALARRRLPDADLALADVAALPFAAASFDAVFDFGAIHFVADWQGRSTRCVACCAPAGSTTLSGSPAARSGRSIHWRRRASLGWWRRRRGSCLPRSNSEASRSETASCAPGSRPRSRLSSAT